MKNLPKKDREEFLRILKELGSTEEDLIEFNKKEDLIFSDEWLDGGDSREELIYMKKHLIKVNGKKIRVICVHDIETLTENPRHRNLFIKRKNNGRFQTDNGKVWILKFED